jgi:LmbE family N-acetylglucosaminyl deacetylase
MEKISGKGKIILAVAAHPDDIDFSSSGTIAKLVKEGASAFLLILTNGNKGSSDPKMTREALALIRQKEQEKAAKIVGYKKVFFAGFEDTELLADLRVKEIIVRYIRKLRPDIVFSLDPSNYYFGERGFVNHTDHREAGIATLDSVFPLARDRLTFQHLEEVGLKPHKVKTLFLVNFENANTFFDISETIGIKKKAISAHKSQISKDFIDRLIGWSREAGKKAGCEYAEGFLKLDLPN